jgi:CRP/FNR family nitrogen fixation transcriptional regulator
MGRRDIADYLGLTVETVSRALAILRDEGIIGLRGHPYREI